MKKGQKSGKKGARRVSMLNYVSFKNLTLINVEMQTNHILYAYCVHNGECDG